MAGKQIKFVSGTATAGSSSGYLTLGSTTGFYEKAFGNVSKNNYPTLEIQVSEVTSTQLGIRRVRGPGEGPNYGRDDMSSYAPEIRLTFTAQTSPFTVGKTVTGGTSAAHGVILSITKTSPTAGYLVINTVSGTFQAETITDDNGTPGSASASGAQATVSATVCVYDQLIYNSNDNPLT